MTQILMVSDSEFVFRVQCPEASVLAHAGQNRAPGVADAGDGSRQLLFKLFARVQKTLNSSYKPDPGFLNLPTLSGTRRQNNDTKLSYFAKLKTE